MPLARTLTTAETGAFLETTVLFTLAVAEVHGIAVHDVERRRMLLLAIVFGSGRPGLPRSGVRRWLITRYPTKRWILTISKVVPFGIGAEPGLRPDGGGRMPAGVQSCSGAGVADDQTILCR